MITKVLDETSDSSRFAYECPACGQSGTEQVRGTQVEIQIYCSKCCYPIFFHPLDIPHIAMMMSTFIARIKSISESGPDERHILITPVGHDFMRLSAAIDFPFNRVIGFLDRSDERLKHKFMGYNVYSRSPQTLSDLNPSAIIICSTIFQDEIASEIYSWNLPDFEIVTVYNESSRN